MLRADRGRAPIRRSKLRAYSPERIYKRRRPLRSENRNKTRNTTKQILAMVAAVPATTPNPRMPARIATIRNISA